MIRLASWLFAALLAGCEPDSAQPVLQVDNAWIRAPIAGRAVAAAYCDITNTGPAPVAITGFSGEGFRVEIHETIDEDGMMRMRPVPSLQLAPGETVSLAPGGKHLMLFDFDPDLDSASINAVLEGGGAYWVRFDVRAEGNP